MKLSFDGIELLGIGRKAAEPNLTWANLSLNFTEADNGHVVGVEATLLLHKHPHTTITQLEEEARNQAKSILKEALALLELNDIAALAKSERDRIALERKSLGLVD